MRLGIKSECKCICAGIANALFCFPRRHTQLDAAHEYKTGRGKHPRSHDVELCLCDSWVSCHTSFCDIKAKVLECFHLQTVNTRQNNWQIQQKCKHHNFFSNTNVKTKHQCECKIYTVSSSAPKRSPKLSCTMVASRSESWSIWTTGTGTASSDVWDENFPKNTH